MAVGGCGEASSRPPPPARFGPSPPRGAELRRKRALLGRRLLRHGSCSTEREALPSPRRGGRFRRAAAVRQQRGARGGQPGAGLRPPRWSGREPLCAAVPRAGVAQDRAAVTAAATSGSRASCALGTAGRCATGPGLAAPLRFLGLRRGLLAPAGRARAASPRYSSGTGLPRAAGPMGSGVAGGGACAAPPQPRGLRAALRRGLGS